MLSRRGFPTEHLVDETFGTNVFHVHLEAGASHHGNVQLRALLRMEATLDAVIYKRHEASCNNDAACQISRAKAGRSLVSLTLICQYPTARCCCR